MKKPLWKLAQAYLDRVRSLCVFAEGLHFSALSFDSTHTKARDFHSIQCVLSLSNMRGYILWVVYLPLPCSFDGVFLPLRSKLYKYTYLMIIGRCQSVGSVEGVSDGCEDSLVSAGYDSRDCGGVGAQGLHPPLGQWRQLVCRLPRHSVHHTLQ